MANKNLHAAKSAKQDEFYTQLSDIEKELKFYRDEFRGKVVYCNCDDARESNFFKFFSLQFEFLGLKKLICTGYKENGKGVVLIYEGDKNGNKRVDDEEIVVKELNGNGDFRSAECIEFLKESDIVVTNPPFSLFREYFAQLMEYGKKFLIIGNLNAIADKVVFPYIKSGKLWMGMTAFNGGAAHFIAPIENYVPEKMSNQKNAYFKDGKFYWRVNGVRWFTNLPNTKAQNPIVLVNKYNEIDYPTYDNYNAVDCGKIVNLPKDMPIGSVVGAPITIAEKIASDGKIYFESDCQIQEWKIIGKCGDLEWATNECSFYTPPAKELCEKYKKQDKTWRVQNAYFVTNGQVQTIYTRIFIERIK